MRLRGKIESEERRVSWSFIISFLLGSIFAELTSDILSDVLFFKRAEQGAFTPLESVVYWYYIPATMYFVFLILAIVLSYLGFKAKYFTILLSIFADLVKFGSSKPTKSGFFVTIVSIVINSPTKSNSLSILIVSTLRSFL